MFKIGMVLLMHVVSVNDLIQKLNFRGGWIFQVHQLGGPPDTAAEGGDADAGELWGVGPEPVHLLPEAEALPDWPRVQDHGATTSVQTRQHGENPRSG